MLRQREQQRDKLDGTDCVKSKSSPSQPSSYRPELYAGAISKRSPRAINEHERSNTKNRPTAPKIGTAAPRDPSQHGGSQKDGSTHGETNVRGPTPNKVAAEREAK